MDDDLGALRPIERRILKLSQGRVDGRQHSVEDMAGRFRRSPAHIERIRTLASWKLQHPSTLPPVEEAQLRPIERRVLKLASGEAGGRRHTAAEMAEKFRRSPDHIERIQRLTSWKLEGRESADS